MVGRGKDWLTLPNPKSGDFESLTCGAATFGAHMSVTQSQGGQSQRILSRSGGEPAPPGGLTDPPPSVPSVLPNGLPFLLDLWDVQAPPPPGRGFQNRPQPPTAPGGFQNRPQPTTPSGFTSGSFAAGGGGRRARPAGASPFVQQPRPPVRASPFVRQPGRPVGGQHAPYADIGGLVVRPRNAERRMLEQPPVNNPTSFSQPPTSGRASTTPISSRPLQPGQSRYDPYQQQTPATSSTSFRNWVPNSGFGPR